MRQSDAADIESIIARTALKYDLLPYTSNPFPQSQPGRLGALGKLSGLDVAPLASARVLELGCAAGGNIIPLAARYPGARFVGVDLSRTQVAAGRARIGHLGLTNIEILCQSFTELGAKDGEFDYIVCHGVYSWVPAPVREAILRICRERLSPLGIAYVSYNVLPGWRMLQTLRDSLLLHVPDTNDPRQRIAQARGLLAFLREKSPQTGVYKQILDTWCDRLAQLPDDYVTHEFLEEVNEPCTFRDFVAALDRNGLAFLAETDLPSMILENYPEGVAEQLRQLANGQLVAVEQYLDILNGRTFRQSLMVSGRRFNDIRRDITPERVEGLHFLCGADLQLSRDASGGVVRDSSGRALNSGSSLVVDALETLIARFPASSTIDDLLGGLSQEARNEENRALLRDALLKMALVGLVVLSSEAVSACPRPSDRPKACIVAVNDAARGESFTTNLRHERVWLDPVAQALLPKLDGASDAGDLAAHLVRLGKEGRLTFSFDGRPVTEEEAMRRIAEEQTTACLQSLARNALLTA